MPKNRHRLAKSQTEIEAIARGGKILGDILKKTASLVKPGVSTWELNDYVEMSISQAGGRPSFKGYGPKNNPFPSALCASVNEVVVHGIPSRTPLADGDIVSLDVGMEYQGYYTDTALTVAVGNISPQAKKLIATTRQALKLAIAQAKPGRTTGDIGYAIQQEANRAGFSVVRDLVGHGVGYEVHEDPAIPCYGKPGSGTKLAAGMVLAIEPMICQGEHYLEMDEDGWTIRTKDRYLAAHFEHTVAVREKGAEILT